MKKILEFIGSASMVNYNSVSFLKEDVEELIAEGDVRVFVEEDVDNKINLKLFTRPNERFGGGPVETGDVMTIDGGLNVVKEVLSQLRENSVVCKHTLSSAKFFEKLARFAEDNGFEHLGGGRIKGPRGDYRFSVQDFPREDELQFGGNGVYYSWDSLRVSLNTTREQVSVFGNSATAYKASERGIVDINDYASK